MADLSIYLPQDRRQALARGEVLPDRTSGSALLADISGFTPLTEALTQALGPRLGAEKLAHQLDRVYAALIVEVNRYGGSVLGFAGDAITCWFDDAPAFPSPQMGGGAASRAVAAALAMQAVMRAFQAITLPHGDTTTLALKVAVATGPAQRFAVGDPQYQILDALAGETITRMAAGEHLAETGEVLADEATVAALGAALHIAAWRVAAEPPHRFALITGADLSTAAHVGPDAALSTEQVQGWVLPAVYARETSGQGSFLTEFRPCVVLFVRFVGIDYDADTAGPQLDVFVRKGRLT